MRSESPWPQKRLGDLVDYPRRSVDPSTLGDELVDLYSIPAFDRGGPERVAAFDIKSNKYEVPEGAVLISRLNPRIPRVWTPALNSGVRSLTSTEFAVLKPSDASLDGAFLGYLASSKWVMGAMQSLVTGTSGSHQRVRPDDVLDVSIPVPPIAEQRAIAEVLGAIDDKIAVNAQLADRLDRLATTIFREWFVNFRFPGHENVPLVDSPLGPIPEGWSVVRLGDVADVNSESIRPKDAPADIRYIDISSVSPGSIDAVTTMPFAEAPSRARRVVRHGDTIWSTVRPNRRSFALVLNPAENTIASTGFAVVRPTMVPWVFLHLATSTMEFSDYLANHARGSAYPAVNAEDFNNAQILMPNAELVGQFAPLVEPMFELRENLRHQSFNLRATRDFLLPKLVSGELRLVDAEKLVGEAL